MQNKEQSALLVHRENYIVPKGEEHAVHYKIAKLTENGEFIEQPRIVKSRVKLFESVTKRGLELNGYTVEILYHPNGTYSNVRIEDKNVLIKKQDAEIAELKAKLAEQTSTDKDAEIAALKAEIKAMKKKADKPAKEGKSGKPAKGNKSDKDEKPKEE
jgi:hypothetical protein